jgi:ferric-dicitrate binding protein FerR (iron transport regulator)/tetratricopeptide (TPR) repeat protein
MNHPENNPPPNLPPNSGIGDQNIERLLGHAYRPESVDPEFANRVEQAMCAAARDAAEGRAAAAAPKVLPYRPTRWTTITWSAVAATLLIGVGFVAGHRWNDQVNVRSGFAVHYAEPGEAARSPATSPAVSTMEKLDESEADRSLVAESRVEMFRAAAGAALPAQPAPEVVPPVAAVADAAPAGDTLQTASGERRRVGLADGSILFMDQNTRVHVDAEREITVQAGEVYLQVSPRQTNDGAGTRIAGLKLDDALQAGGQGTPEAQTFLVHAADRTFTALGTKFAVRFADDVASLFVTQGRVRVNDVAEPVAAGQQLVPQAGPVYKFASRVTALPRASAVLDWTRDLVSAAEPPLVSASEHSGGSIVARDPNGQETRLSLRKYNVDVFVEDGFARTTIDQTYFNHTSWRLEGTFFFPLPPDASLSRLAMYVDGKLMEGGMAERNYARDVFESIVRKQKDPALLEWVDGSTFKMRVFPLEARQEKRIVLSYTQRLETLYGNWKYRFPAGHSLEAVRDWSFHGRVKRGADLTWSCDSHELKQSADAGDLVLDAQANEVKLDRDVVLRLSDRAFTGRANPDAPASASQKSVTRPASSDAARFSSSTHDGQRYFMVRYRPDLPSQAQRQRRDWVFLFESSGDRDSLLARVQADVIKTILQNAEHDDTFVILTAGTQVRTFVPEAMRATPENVKRASEFLDGVHLVGSLDLGQALDAVAPFVGPDKNAYLVHVGSGTGVLGERAEDKLLQRVPAGAHYVGVGVGKRWSRSFMKAAAGRTGGYFTQVNPDEPVAWRAFDLYSTLNTPRLLGITVERAGKPQNAAPFLCYDDSIAHGEELCAIARLNAIESPPERLVVTGMLDGAPFRRELAVESVSAGADYLPRTWAKLRIDQLVTDSAAEHREEIVALSKAMYVMSPFTSLLVLENEQMYVQFGVDRGRKDHWAMYACPPEIPVVFEAAPVPQVLSAMAGGVNAGNATKQLADDVLRTIPATQDPWGWRLRASGSPLGYFLAANALGDAPNDFEFEFGININAFSLPGSQNGQVPSNFWIDHFDSGVSQGLGISWYAPRQRFDYFFESTPTLGKDKAAVDGVRKPDVASLYTPQQQRVESMQRLRRLGVDVLRGTPQALEEAERAKQVTDMVRMLSEEEFRLEKVNRRYRAGADASRLSTIEYPDATWWEEMTKRRKNWSRVDLRALSLGRSPAVEWDFDGEARKSARVLSFLESDYSRAMQWSVPRLETLEDAWRKETSFGANRAGGPAQALSLGTQNKMLRELRGDEVDVLRKRFQDVQQSVRGEQKAGLAAANVQQIKDQQKNYDSLLQNYQEANRFIELKDLYESLESRTNRPEHRRSFGNYARSEMALGGQAARGFEFGDWPTAEQLAEAMQKQLLTDLLAFAPGFYVTVADLEAILDKESDQPAPPQPGDVDPRARKLIEAARGASWQTLEIGGQIGQSTERITLDGSGRYASYRKTPDGLVEESICDGETLWNLYPELGIGAVRPVSRFHRYHLQALVPWLLDPVDEMARGLDLKCVDERTVAVLPHGAEDARDENGKPLDFVCEHLMFSEDGRLGERQVLVLPRHETLARETYGADGTVKRYDGTDRVIGEFKFGRQPAEAPNLVPETSGLVVLPVPARTRDYVFQATKRPQDGRFEAWTDDEALRLLAADLWENPWESMQIVGQRFLSRGDRRIGFYVLLFSTGVSWDPQTETALNNGTRVRFDPVADHPNSVVAKYIFLHQQQVAKSGKIAEMDLFAAGRPQGPVSAGVGGFGSRAAMAKGRVSGDLVQQLAGFHDLQARFGFQAPAAEPEAAAAATGKTGVALKKAETATTEGKFLGQTDHEKALSFLKQSNSPLFFGLVVRLCKDRLPTPEAHRELAEALLRFQNSSAMSYAARYEAARQYDLAGDWQRARDLFSELFASAVRDGFVLAIDDAFGHAFQTGGADGPERLKQVFRDAATTAFEKSRPAVVAIAARCHRFSDKTLAEELFAKALTGVGDDQRTQTMLAGVAYLAHTEQYERADTLLQPLLENDALNKFSLIWRIAAVLAEKHGMIGRSAADLDRALEIDLENAPKEIELEAVRARFTEVLARYQQLSDSIVTAREAPPQDVVNRITRLVDRWRSLDPEGSAACLGAARALERLGAPDVAWDYATTPFSEKPNEGPTWLPLAQTLRGQGSIELAGRAFERAIAAEAKNPQILWEHAQMLEQSGNSTAAQVRYRQIAEGSWDASFQSIQDQARKALQPAAP